MQHSLTRKKNPQLYWPFEVIVMYDAGIRENEVLQPALGRLSAPDYGEMV